MRELDRADEVDTTTRSASPPVVRWIGVDDVAAALRLGLADFRAIPTHGILFGLVYAIVGFVLVRVAQDAALLPLIFPLVSGFALLGPFLAIGLYELSRRREQGLSTRWWHVFGVRRHASPGPLLALGGVLAILFVLWLAAADALFGALIGEPPDGIGSLIGLVLTTDAGWALIIAGHTIGFLFALVVFALSAVSFPLLVDREIGLLDAVRTSIRAVTANPLPMAVWAAIIAIGLVVGSAPLLLGLPVVLPILGHSTWHLYRRVVLP